MENFSVLKSEIFFNFHVDDLFVFQRHDYFLVSPNTRESLFRPNFPKNKHFLPLDTQAIDERKQLWKTYPLSNQPLSARTISNFLYLTTLPLLSVLFLF